MGSFQSHDVLVNNIKIHYQVTSGKGPPLILVHGFSSFGSSWYPTAHLLKNNYQIYLPDNRGHGYSDATETEYGPTDRVSDLAGFIHKLNLNKPCIVGHSLGADTAARMAAEYPDLTACLVLIDPPWLEFNEPSNQMPAQIEKTRLEIRHRMTLPLKILILLGKNEHPSWTEEEIHTWALGKKLVNPHALQSIDLLDPDWQSPVSLIGVPTLLITGDLNLGGLVSPEVSALFDSLCPVGEVVRISNAGHSIQMDQFHQFSNYLTHFLRKYYPWF